MRIVVLAGIAAAGCGSVSAKDIDASVASDVAPHDTSTIDTPPPRCNPNAAFGTPAELVTLDTISDDESPFLSADELTLYFGSNRAGTGGYDIYKATRATTTAQFGGATQLTGVNTAGDERVPRLSSDELTLIAAYKPTGSTTLRVGISLRASTAVAFPALQQIANVSGTANDTEPTLLPSGNVIYFASDRGGNYNIYRTEKTGTAFGAPVSLAGALNTASTESSPTVTPDELHIYFLSDRVGTQGTYDIYTSSRTSTVSPFSAAVPVPELNSTSIDYPSWISPDNCVMYFTRQLANRGYDMYVATRGN